MISQRIGWLTERQKVLAENVANADTPNFKARDVKELSFQQMLRGTSNSLGIARTAGQHITGGGGAPGTFGRNDVSKEKQYETTLSGNSVTLDVELMKISQTAHDHQLATQLYRKHLNMFRTVIGRGGA